MNFELKQKINPKLLLTVLALCTAFFGAIAIVYRSKGIVMIPLIASFLAVIMCIEKRRTLSITVFLILFMFETYYGMFEYFTIISLSSLVLSIIIALCYLNGVRKSQCALYSTISVVLSLIITLILYLIHEFNDSSISNLLDHFISFYNVIKEKAIIYFDTSIQQSSFDKDLLSTELLNEMFDAYLNCMIAIVSILAFLIVGITHKLFTSLIRRCEKNTDKINSWDFIPSSVFAYAYFIMAFVALFVSDPENTLSVSLVNLHLIFMFVFAYVGFKFINVMMKFNGRNPFLSSLILLTLTFVFSSFAIQLLAIIGAILATKYDKIIQNHDFSNNNLSNNRR